MRGALLQRRRGVDVEGVAVGIVKDDFFPFVAAHVGGEAVVPTHLPPRRRRQVGKDDRHLAAAIVQGGWTVDQVGSPIAVPLEIVEAFLLGQASMGLPSTTKSTTETRTVVVRLAEKATDWSQRRVNPLLGNWCEGYITIRGTWCEPLDADVVKRLNRKLAQTTRSMQT